MVLDPGLIDESLKNNNAKHLYERFRASKAFEELDKEIKEFEAQPTALIRSTGDRRNIWLNVASVKERTSVN